MNPMNRPALHEVPINTILDGDATLLRTIKFGEWDAQIQSDYDRGFVLLEIKDDAMYKTYQKQSGAN